MSGLGISHQLMGQTDQATNVIDGLIEFSQEAGESGHIDVAESCNARLSFMRGESKMGLEWARSYDAETHVPSMNFWLEIPVITQTRILILAGTNDDVVRALGLLDSLVKGIDKLHNTYQKIEILVLQSVALDKLERTTEAQTFLEEAVNKAQPGGWIRPFVEAGPTMPDMLKRLEAKDITGEYIEKLINTMYKLYRYTGGGSSDPIRLWSRPKSQRHVPGGESEYPYLTGNGCGHPACQRKSEQRNRRRIIYIYRDHQRHLSNVFQKLNVNSRMQVISKSKELGIIE